MTVLRTQGAGTARAVELLGLARNGRKLVARPRLHAALERGRLVAAIAKIRGDLLAALAVRAHDHHGRVLVQRLERAVQVVVGADGSGDVTLGELLIAAKVERLRTIARDQLARPLGRESLLVQLRSHRGSATPAATRKTACRRRFRVIRCDATAPRRHRGRRSPDASGPPCTTSSSCAGSAVTS